MNKFSRGGDIISDILKLKGASGPRLKTRRLTRSIFNVAKGPKFGLKPPKLPTVKL